MSAFEVIDGIGADEEHGALFSEQAPLITRARTEIYQILDL